MKYIDLFCGIGSFHYSFRKLGFKCIMACDTYEPAKRTYKQNYNVDVLDDICNIDPTKFEYDILCAGFPCQPFSQAGYQRGFEDSRGTMFAEVMRFVKQSPPKVVILENVPGILKHDNGKSFEKIKHELESEGYKVIYDVLTCSKYGIPQMRKRLFIIGLKNINITQIDSFFDLSEYECNTNLTQYLGKNFEKEVAYTIRCGGKNSPINDRHNWDGYWVDKQEYRLTINDCLKLQGFEHFGLIGKANEQWKMLGNTIPTIFTHMIGRQILKYISNK